MLYCCCRNVTLILYNAQFIGYYWMSWLYEKQWLGDRMWNIGIEFEQRSQRVHTSNSVCQCLTTNIQNAIIYTSLFYYHVLARVTIVRFNNKKQMWYPTFQWSPIHSIIQCAWHCINVKIFVDEFNSIPVTILHLRKVPIDIYS